MQTLNKTRVLVALGAVVLVITGAARGGAATAGPGEQCRTISGIDGRMMLQRAAHVMGMDEAAGMVRRSMVAELISDGYQADRMYAPTPYRVVTPIQYAVDWENRVQGRVRTLPANAPPAVAAQFKPSLLQIPTDAAMDPWMVIADWQASAPTTSSWKATTECYYRDYWRTVLTRKDTSGVEFRLFIDGKSGYPVKMDRRESHYLWGDRLVEYVWTTWYKVGSASAPRSAFMVADGETERAWTHTSYALVPRDSMGVPMTPAPLPVPPATASNTIADTIRVAPNIFMLTTPAYNNVVMLQRDTVFILDAQISEDRARGDSVWIGKLFPGRHPMVLVVTDLAWPHIAGVRYWVATGVPIVTHTASVDFLNQVIRHPWTLHPDLLEQRRATVHPVIRATDTPLDLARGAVKIAPIDGIASEGALMAYAPNEKFLYAGDYIQQGNLTAPRPGLLRFTYLEEVVAAAQKHAWGAATFGAMHVKPLPWANAVAAAH